MSARTHGGIRESIRKRIIDGEWGPGAAMPGEVEFALEYGCARATVNRALRTLAEDGLIERKRRAGTRVRDVPVRNATVEIPLIRKEIESNGHSYRPHVLLNETALPPSSVRATLEIANGDAAVHLQTLHLADDRAFAFEDRWVNLKAAPGILDAPLDVMSANEWLLRKIPYSNASVAFYAVAADAAAAKALGVDRGAPLFVLDRTTWQDQTRITAVQIHYHPDYRLRTSL